MIAKSSHVHAGIIRSEFVTFPGGEGRKVAAYVDCLEGARDNRPWVVIVPKYGETKKNNLQTAYYLAANQVNVLRFDLTNHVGESDGAMSLFTLPGAVEDIHAAFDYLKQVHGVRKAGLLANSLSARMAIRAAATDRRVHYLVSLVGVVHVQRTLAYVYQEDVVANYLGGKRWGLNDVLGFDIDFEHFLGALVTSGMHTLAGTVRDIAAIDAPVAFLSAEKDAWVDIAEVRQAIADAPRCVFREIRDAMHEIRENPEAGERTFREIVALCLGWAHGREISPEKIVIPDRRLYLKQNKIERDRYRKANPDVTSETEFWSKYLSKYGYFENVDVYQYYIGLVGGLLGPLKAGDTLLDAGCGNGLFGAWVLRDLVKQKSRMLEPPPVYVGIDLTNQGLLDAFKRHDQIRREVNAAAAGQNTPMDFAYVQMDLDQFGGVRASKEGMVDFASNTFDKICCSLVISYLVRPADLILELYRILRPGGRIVITSMKPFADLSDLYRRYVANHTTEQEVESAKDLLRAAGKIKVKEELGYYTFFSGEEMAEAMKAAGFKNIEATMSFGNQATVVAAEK
jgi:SAM-dependent methyltransferase/pimeloyl-ACP methyl ester carboxylesterase